MCVHQRRQIDAVRTQRHCVVFVYQELGEPGSSPHSQTDSGSSSPCLFIIDQGDGCLPSGLRRGNFSSYLSFSLTSLSPSLPLFAQHLNVLVQTLFSPAGREVPYAHPVKAAVVMDTGKHQEIKQALDSAGRSVTLYLKGFFFLHRTPRPSLSSSPTDETPVKLLCCLYCFIYFVAFSLCWGTEAVCNSVHRAVVHFCLRFDIQLQEDWKELLSFECMYQYSCRYMRNTVRYIISTYRESV